MSTEEVISFDHPIFDDPEKFEYTPAFTVKHLIKLSADTIPIDRLKHMYLIMHNDQTNRRLAYTICDDLFSNIDIAKTRVLIRIIKSVLRDNNNDSNNGSNAEIMIRIMLIISSTIIIMLLFGGEKKTLPFFSWEWGGAASSVHGDDDAKSIEL